MRESPDRDWSAYRAKRKSDAEQTASSTNSMKEKRRAWLQAKTAGLKVTYCPTLVHVHCRKCGNNRQIEVPYGRRNPRFRCSNCGTRI